MQQDVSTPTTPRPRTRRVRATVSRGEGNLQSYVSNASDTISQAGGYVAQRARTQPLIFGSILFGLIGAIVGNRIAYTQAERQRKSFYQRVADSVGSIGHTISSGLSGRTSGPIDSLRERGMDVSKAARSVGAMNAMPSIGTPRLGGGRGMLPFLPIAFTLLRNPMIRNMGLRLLSRRMGSRR